MKYCLYANDITMETTPLEARLGWITKLDKGNFIGRDALVKQKEEGIQSFRKNKAYERYLGLIQSVRKCASNKYSEVLINTDGNFNMENRYFRTSII